MARFGALTELDFDHLHLGVNRLAGKAIGVKVALRISAAKIARTNFPNQVATVNAVVA